MLDVQKQEYNKKGKYTTNFCHFIFWKTDLLECFSDLKQFIFSYHQIVSYTAYGMACFLFPEIEKKTFLSSKIFFCKFELMSK